MEANIVKSTMKSGLILGVLFSVNFLLSIPSNVITNLLSLVMIGIIIVATFRLSKQFRDNECEGYISYGKAFVFVLFSFFFASIISALVKIVYYQFINPDYLFDLYNQQMLMLEQLNMPITDELETLISGMLKPVPIALLSILGNMILGVVVGLIMAAFVKKEKSIFEQ